MYCPRCNSLNIAKKGSILAARGRVQRYECKDCWKKFHPSLKLQPILEKEGYWDIETSQAGRGAGNFGIIYCWAIMDRITGKIEADHMKSRTRAEEKRIVSSMLKAMRDFDRLYTWYGTGHDVPISRSRAEYYGLDFPGYQEVAHVDLYYAFRGKFKLHSNRQDAAAEFFGQPAQKHHLKPEIWTNAMFNDTFTEAIKHIDLHCKEDVAQTKWVHERIEKYMMGNRRTL